MHLRSKSNTWYWTPSNCFPEQKLDSPVIMQYWICSRVSFYRLETIQQTLSKLVVDLSTTKEKLLLEMSKVFCRNNNQLLLQSATTKTIFRCLMRAFYRPGRYIPFSKSRKCLKMQMSQSMNTFKQCKTRNLNYKPNHCSISSVLSILERIHGPAGLDLCFL